jgi:hypothetical protein
MATSDAFLGIREVSMLEWRKTLIASGANRLQRDGPLGSRGCHRIDQ